MVLRIHTRREQRSLFWHFKCELGEEQNFVSSDKIFLQICSCSGNKFKKIKSWLSLLVHQPLPSWN